MNPFKNEHEIGNGRKPGGQEKTYQTWKRAVLEKS